MLMENWQSFRLLERKEYNLKPWKKNRNLIVIRDRWGPSKDRWAVHETRWCLTKRLRKTCMKKVTSLFRAHGSREKGSSGFRGPLRYVQKLLKSGCLFGKKGHKYEGTGKGIEKKIFAAKFSFFGKAEGRQVFNVPLKAWSILFTLLF